MTVLPDSPPDTEVEELSQDACRALLSLVTVGRIAFVVDGLPVVFPVNYRLLSDGCGVRILLRTRPGRAIDAAPQQVAFEIDGIDHNHQQGWSVLARGDLDRLDHDEIEALSDRFDPKPWPQRERTSWLAIKAHTLSGRRLRAPAREWAFPSEAYL